MYSLLLSELSDHKLTKKMPFLPKMPRLLAKKRESRAKTEAKPLKSVQAMITVDIRALRLDIKRCTRAEIMKRENIPESTLHRYLKFAYQHVPTFAPTPRNGEFDEFQAFTIAWLRRHYQAGCRSNWIVKKIKQGDLNREYQKAAKKHFAA